MQLAFRFLSMIRVEDDPFTFVQAHWSVALAMMVIGNPNLAWKHYQRAITVIRRHDIRFTPKVNTHYPGISSVTAGFIPSEGDHERVAFLAKILYLEAFLYFYVSGMPGAKVWANRDHEDRLPVWMRMLPEHVRRARRADSSASYRVVQVGSAKTLAAFVTNSNANSGLNFR